MKATLIHGDCMDVMAGCAENEFDLAIVDPPYNLQRFRNGIGVGERMKVKASSGFNNNAPTQDYFYSLFNLSENQIIWGANNFQLPPSEYFCIWDKQQTVDNFASAEYAWISMGLKKPAKVFRYSIHQHNSDCNKIHPTQKPVKLYKWLLKNYAKEGDTILDTHGGSFSSVIACIEMGFDITCIEKDEDYFDDAVKRVQRHVDQGDIFRDNVEIEIKTQEQFGGRCNVCGCLRKDHIPTKDGSCSVVNPASKIIATYSPKGD